MTHIATIFVQTLQTAKAKIAAQKQGAQNQMRTAVSDVTK